MVARRATKLRVIAGGQRAKAEVAAIEEELAAIGRRLSRVGDRLRVAGLGDHDAFTGVLWAAADVSTARLALGFDTGNDDMTTTNNGRQGRRDEVKR